MNMNVQTGGFFGLLWLIAVVYAIIKVLGSRASTGTAPPAASARGQPARKISPAAAISMASARSSRGGPARARRSPRPGWR